MPDPDAQLPDDPFRSGSPAVDSFTHGIRIAETLHEARSRSREELLRVFSGLELEDFAALADATMILRANGRAVDEERRRRVRPWTWRVNRWPPWR